MGLECCLIFESIGVSSVNEHGGSEETPGEMEINSGVKVTSIENQEEKEIA